jgi:hypothetical protein
VKIVDDNFAVRNMDAKDIVYNDPQGLENYKKAKKLAQSKETRLNKIEEDLDIIKSLLLKLTSENK